MAKTKESKLTASYAIVNYTKCERREKPPEFVCVHFPPFKISYSFSFSFSLIRDQFCKCICSPTHTWHIHFLHGITIHIKPSRLKAISSEILPKLWSLLLHLFSWCFVVWLSAVQHGEEKERQPLAQPSLISRTKRLYKANIHSWSQSNGTKHITMAKEKK